MNVLIRNVDRDTYRKLKAQAAAKGYTISVALEEAIRTWLKTEERNIFSEMDANGKAYRTVKRNLLKEHRGKYAVFCDGEMVGVADTLEKAGALVRRAGAARALTVKVGESKPSAGEWLWSSLELFAA